MAPRTPALCLVTLLCASALADIVLHNPRGSNNRLNDRNSNRDNNNRLFDSQNNNRGGYNVGDATDEPFETEDQQYDMKYFQSDASGGKSYLHVEWTNQHGCGDINGEGGGAQRRYCDVIMQYMCQDDREAVDALTSATCYPVRQPSLYNGKVNRTVSGRDCQAWSSQAPHRHGHGNSKDDFIDNAMPNNYCREPLNDGQRGQPWCYTTDPKKQWEYCDVDYCETDEVFDNCYPIGKPSLYIGKLSTTETGFDCHPWGEHNKVFIDGKYPENYCREHLNDGGRNAPWCYSSNPKKHWERCGVPRCSMYFDVKDKIQNGRSTRSQDFRQPRNEAEAQRSHKLWDVKEDRGLHESWDWYKQCYVRQNNGGLFLADQELAQTNLDRSAAIHTRQNNNGGRSGYECPEDKDYWPYWQVTPWTDVAILTSDTSRCDIYKKTSQNSAQRGRCYEVINNKDHISQYITQEACEANGGEWLQVSAYLEKATDKTEDECTGFIKGTGLQYAWRIPYDAAYGERVAECLVLPPEVDCQQAEYSRMNHQGNTKDGQMLSYQWELPYFPSENNKRCAFRIRYNISTFDYDPFGVSSADNGENSPITNNPAVDVIADKDSGKALNLQLAINTAQFGRTFQDRSHVFELKPREPDMIGKIIYNLNVRGRRGNIVQAYPSVEYDFVPFNLSMSTEDLLHVQWTGSNSNPDDAGQGRARTDRNNLVPVNDPGLNVPVSFNDLNSQWKDVEVVWSYYDKTDILAQDLYVNMASSGYYRCLNDNNCDEEENAEYLVSSRDQMQNQLNNAPASYPGVMLKFTSTGDYYFICTRNNAFTNRAQKGQFTVNKATPALSKAASRNKRHAKQLF